ncbi:hypothetical protein [Parabacteroides pacaensis]|uniref:hypothetical protein n=1 Tax=Parabacteroides pacaensis TaxID=2086575 RepID=UPI00131E6D9C|nr:hypothetical protein [Parabacteroides pacaensis]
MNMRLNIIFVFLFLLAASIHGQSPSFIYANTSMTVNEANIRKEKLSFDYKQTPEWKRYKILKATGWTAVGVGGAMLIGGFIGDIIDNYERSGNDTKLRYRIVWRMGAGVAAASVPLLTFAYINRHKAKKATAFSLTISDLSVDLPNGVAQSRPTLGISVKF